MKKLIVLAIAAAFALPACAVVEKEEKGGPDTLVVRDRAPDTVIVRERDDPDVDIHVR